jgi:hypothetical protein
MVKGDTVEVLKGKNKGKKAIVKCFMSSLMAYDEDLVLLLSVGYMNILFNEDISNVKKVN